MYFLMGDNRYHSADSRITDIGCVPQKYIIGKAIFRLTPFSKMGGLYKD
jgi:signal peptidase I